MEKSVKQDVKWNAAVGHNIAAARKRAGMTAAALARAIGISQERMYWYEAGRVSCPARLLCEIAQELRVRIESLMSF